MHDTVKRIVEVRARIAAAAARAGRNAADVELLAVSKTRSPEQVQVAVDAGIDALGENRVQEAEGKMPSILGNPTWHLIGGLQSNKAGRAARLFDVVHSLDRLKLVLRLDRAATAAGRIVRGYVQVDYTRAGLDEEHAEERARQVAMAVHEAAGLELVGFMILPPFDADPEAARPWFRRLRQLRDRLAPTCGGASGLSMGMSNDFEVAIEEGATIVRIGTTIFGSRP